MSHPKKKLLVVGLLVISTGWLAGTMFSNPDAELPGVMAEAPADEASPTKRSPARTHGERSTVAKPGRQLDARLTRQQWQHEASEIQRALLAAFSTGDATEIQRAQARAERFAATTRRSTR